jgi:hypothetical protein
MIAAGKIQNNDPSTATFRVKQNGEMCASAGNIGGITITKN